MAEYIELHMTKVGSDGPQRDVRCLLRGGSYEEMFIHSLQCWNKLPDSMSIVITGYVSIFETESEGYPKS